MGNVNGRVVEVDLGDKKVTLDKVYGNQYVVCVDQLRGDTQTIVSAVEECIQYMVNRGGGEIIVPPNAEEDEVRIKVYKNKESHEIEVRFQVRSFRPPIEEETRPYTGDDWEVGDLVLGTPNEGAVVYAWICKESGVPGVWEEVGASNEDLTLVNTNFQKLGQQIKPMVELLSGTYQGVDLADKFRDEIALYSDPWAWIQARLDAANFSGIYPGDYIEYQTGLLEDTGLQYTVHQQIAGIDTYYGTGITSPIGHHIDWVSKECITEVPWNDGSGTNVIPWEESVVAFYLGNTLYNILPEQVQRVIKDKDGFIEYRSAQTDATLSISLVDETYGRLWLPTEKEVFGVVHNGNPEGNSKSIQYPLFRDIPGSRIKKIGDVTIPWWLSSVAYKSLVERCAVSADGFPHKDNNGESIINAVPICFRMMQTEE